MVQDIYDPLTEYVNVFRDRFKDVARDTFAQLSAEAKVDVEANRDTCQKMYAAENEVFSAKKHTAWWTVLCVLLWGGVAVSATYFIVTYQSEYKRLESWVYIVGACAIVAVVLSLLLFIHPKIKKLKNEQVTQKDTADALKEQAWQQMQPLNRLYDWDVLTRMMAKTVPRLQFDPYFSTQRLADLQVTYGWDDSFNKERSVLYSHSGVINGNPFVICRTRKMVMGKKTYSGEKTIHWTYRMRGADGKYQSIKQSQTLKASVTVPYPYYFEKTRLIYGNTAAPDLIFYRKKSGLAGQEDTWSFKKKRNALRKKARDLSNNDFAMMTNEEFETIFDTSNRNNNQQFALLFTPLAQESMSKLLRDKEIGYGDDFDFSKNKMINAIVPDHLQSLDLDLSPVHYKHFDYDCAEKNFYEINANYFRAIYFSLAPLLCVPMYQQIRPQADIYGHDMKPRSAFWEHEALANYWGQKRFKHPDCVTKCILKTVQDNTSSADSSTITVYAHGYKAKKRVTYVSVYGGDGKAHKVAVYWPEYLPVIGKGTMQIKEDNEGDKTTQSEQISHIHNMLGKSGLSLYRRHICSKV